MSRYSAEGLRVPTMIFEAAAWAINVKVICSRCPNYAIFEPGGLWWLFHSKGWDDNFAAAPRHFYCMVCAIGGLARVRPRRLEAVKDKPMKILPPPPDREWKRAIRRFRC